MWLEEAPPQKPYLIFIPKVFFQPNYRKKDHLQKWSLMKAFVLLLTFCLVTVSCNEIKPQIKVSFINLTGMTLNNIQTAQGRIGTLLPQQTSSKVRFPELKSMTDPKLEIKLSAEIDGQRYNQLAEFRVFDPASYSVPPGDYVGEIRVSASNTQLPNYSLNNSIKGFFVKLIKQP